MFSLLNSSFTIIPNLNETSKNVNALNSLHCLVLSYQWLLQHRYSIVSVHSILNMSEYVTMSSSHWSVTSSNHLLTVCHWELAVVNYIHYSIPTKPHWNTSLNRITHYKNTFFCTFKYCFIVSDITVVSNISNEYWRIWICNLFNN